MIATSLTADEAFRLGGAWHRRLAGLARDDPARSPGWLRAWYEASGEAERDPVFVAEEPGGGVAALLALSRHGAPTRAPLRYLRSTTNGSSNHAALLVDAAAGAAAVHRLLDHALDAAGWDVLTLRGVEAALATCMREWAAERGLACDAGAVFTSQALTFGEDRSASVPPRSKNTRSRERALAAIGALRMRVVSEGAGREAALAAEARSWKAERGHLISHSPELVAFFRVLDPQRRSDRKAVAAPPGA